MVAGVGVEGGEPVLDETIIQIPGKLLDNLSGREEVDLQFEKRARCLGKPVAESTIQVVQGRLQRGQDRLHEDPEHNATTMRRTGLEQVRGGMGKGQGVSGDNLPGRDIAMDSHTISGIRPTWQEASAMRRAQSRRG